jgi:hypothetical protein
MPDLGPRQCRIYYYANYARAVGPRGKEAPAWTLQFFYLSFILGRQETTWLKAARPLAVVQK